jgi:predicted DNA-binding WGR domain protein
MRMDRREFQFIDGSSKKFWAIELEGPSLTVHFGRIGTAGQTKEKSFSDADAAKREYEKLVTEKTKNGYVETHPSDAAPVSETPSAYDAATPGDEEDVTTGVTAADASSDTGASSREAASAPSREAAVVARDVPLERRVKLPDEDWARITWRPRKPERLTEPRPFNFDACLKQASAAFTGGDFWAFRGWDYWYEVARAIPTRLTKEEAWFWLNVLDTVEPRKTSSDERLRELREVGLEPADDAQVRARIKASQTSDLICVRAPHTLRPFFTPVEITQLTVEALQTHATRSRSSAHYAQVYAVPGLNAWSMLGFAEYVAPHMTEHERRDYRAALEQMYDAEKNPNAAIVLLGFLSTVGGGPRLAAWVANLPDTALGKELWIPLPSPYLVMLAGLADEASFVREVRRLMGVLKAPSDLRLWLAATEWRELDLVKDAIVAAQSKDEAAPLARILALVEAPEAALRMLEVQTGSKAPDIAVEWLATHPLHAAVGLVPAAKGQGKLAEAARDRLHTMRRDGLAPVLNAAMSYLPPDQAVWLQQEILDTVDVTLPELLHAELPETLREAFAGVKTFKSPSWLSVASLPPIKIEGKRLASDEVNGVLATLKATPTGATSVLASALKQHVDPGSLDAFAWKLFEMWQAVGAPAKDKWAMGAVGYLGGDACVLKLTPLVRQWPGENQHARAVFGLQCLRSVGSDTALMALNGVAQKVKFKGLKQKAQEMMEGIAQSRGLTREQLADRIVPDCGLDERGSRVFDFGHRQFRFVLGPEMKPLVRDADGKVRSDLPAPTKADERDKAEAAVAEWKLLKKTLREVLKVQADRLEDAMITGRRWTPHEFQTLLLNHPLMVNLVRQLVLAEYDDASKITQTFRVTEDQTLADHNDDEIPLPSSGQIGVLHPAHLDEALKSAWGQVLSDYEIIPPFAQLGRDICRPNPEDLEGTEITRYRGPMVPGIVMYGILERSHWLRDKPADGAGFNQHSKYFPSVDLTAFIQYTGLSIGYYEQKQELEAVYFVPGHIEPQYWGRHEGRLKIKNVDSVVLSEVLRLAHVIVSKAE